MRYPRFFLFVGGGFISPAICTGKHDQDGRFWGLWNEAGAINGAPTEGAVSLILPFVGGGFISPAI
ncbi:hypothetical protein BSR42_11510 [Megasphaera cerevisiae]|nr:hypothetical protein BSR42_11510 [Megasphaera cerevisiae]